MYTSARSPIGGNGMARILLIDDDGLFREIVKTAFVEGGFEVAEAADGKSGVEAFKAGAFDLVWEFI